MKYLFFDIECCDGFHMCSLGYVIVDSHFNILKKEDILINPESKFTLARAGFNPILELAYSEDEFKNKPNFSSLYESIKSLLTAEDTMLLGFSLDNDFRYMVIDCYKYRLPRLDNLKAYDIQKLHKKIKNLKNVVKLYIISEELGIDISNETKHKSCDDAEVSMLILKKLCEESGLSLEKMLEQNPEFFTNCKDVADRYEKKWQQNNKRRRQNNIHTKTKLTKNKTNKITTTKSRTKSGKYNNKSTKTKKDTTMSLAFKRAFSQKKGKRK